MALLLSVSLSVCQNEALKHFKSIIKCFKEVKIYTLDRIYHIFAIECCIRINHKPDGLLNGGIHA